MPDVTNALHIEVYVGADGRKKTLEACHVLSSRRLRMPNDRSDTARLRGRRAMAPVTELS